MGRKKIGRTRAALPALLVKAFAEIGVTARFEAEHLRPATGYWRTDIRADVYRWEGSGEKQIEDGTWMGISVDSWDTMTDCVRHGVEVSRDGAGYDASAKRSRTHPAVLRAEARKAAQ